MGAPQLDPGDGSGNPPETFNPVFLAVMDAFILWTVGWLIWD